MISTPHRAWRDWRSRRRWRNLAGPKVLREFATRYPRAVFIEIGANDGASHDHLRPFILSTSWTGVMVEPVPYLFERLRQNYAGVERVALENSAIADRDGALPFFYLDELEDAAADGIPEWYHGLGSFSLEGVLEHDREIPDIERRVVRAEVPCLTFDTLCARHGIERPDLVAIDTEGYDYEIVRRIDLDRHRPRLLVYEHFHLSPQARADCRADLDRSGYETMEEHFDTWCLDPGDDELTRVWRRLRPALPGVSAHDLA